jgi:hypothetical protein
MADGADRRFGEQPLPQTVAVAAALRRLTGMVLSLEHPNPTVDEMLTTIAGWERDLADAQPADYRPRMSSDDESKRLYVQRAFDIGSANPVFPEYRFDRLDLNSASGTVTFPIVFEGPPGLVHGGFLGVLFDCITQHHNCAVGRSGKTRSLIVRYRRPTPLEADLRFEIVRTPSDQEITSTASLILDDEVLCTGEVSALALPPEKLSPQRFAHRRTV